MNILLGLFYHSLGSFSSGSFMAPYVKIKKWAFENYWIIMGSFAWLIAPIIIALFTIPNLITVVLSSPQHAIVGAFLFGFFWGIGSITFGLAVRYLGYSLGYALTLGLSSIVGTILPTIVKGELITLFSDFSGHILFIGLLINLVGILFCIKAGNDKDKELDETVKSKQNAEYNYRTGIIVAIICGFFASFTAYGITAGDGIAMVAQKYGAMPIMRNNATLVILLLGGFIFNIFYYIFQNRKIVIAKELIKGKKKVQINNYFFSAISGILWYLQYMFYGMGTTQLGKYHFASWTIHMTLIIAFSNLWGLLFKEWNFCSKRTKNYAIAGIVVIIFSTMVIGYSSYLAN